MSTGPQSPERAVRAVWKYRKSAEIPQEGSEFVHFLSFLSQFEQNQIFEILSVRGTEKVLNFSIEEVINFLGKY